VVGARCLLHSAYCRPPDRSAVRSRIPTPELAPAWADMPDAITAAFSIEPASSNFILRRRVAQSEALWVGNLRRLAGALLTAQDRVKVPSAGRPRRGPRSLVPQSRDETHGKRRPWMFDPYGNDFGAADD
jgi:hypothetical protein